MQIFNGGFFHSYITDQTDQKGHLKDFRIRKQQTLVVKIAMVCLSIFAFYKLCMGEIALSASLAFIGHWAGQLCLLEVNKIQQAETFSQLESQQEHHQQKYEEFNAIKEENKPKLQDGDFRLIVNFASICEFLGHKQKWYELAMVVSFLAFGIFLMVENVYFLGIFFIGMSFYKREVYMLRDHLDQMNLNSICKFLQGLQNEGVLEKDTVSKVCVDQESRFTKEVANFLSPKNSFFYETFAYHFNFAMKRKETRLWEILL